VVGTYGAELQGHLNVTHAIKSVQVCVKIKPGGDKSWMKIALIPVDECVIYSWRDYEEDHHYIKSGN